jgi:hypothetical protein
MLKLHKVKLVCKRTIVHLILFVLLLSGMMVPTPIPAPISIPKVEAQSCSPPGYYSIGGRTYYRWLANSEPENSSCWNAIQGRAAVVQTTTCGWTENTWEFYYGGSISQTFTVPNTQEGSLPKFNIQYSLDFIDPNDDPTWNRFEMRVVDLNTGTTLAYDFFDGSMGDLYCSGRSFSWNQNLAGHTIQVRLKGTRGYSNTFIRVRDIYVYQLIGPYI